MKKVEQGISIGPEGFREGNPNNFAALGTPEEIAELYRARGWSEEAWSRCKSNFIRGLLTFLNQLFNPKLRPLLR